MRCTDRNFIKRLKKQREDALEYIMEHYGGLVHAITYQIIGQLSKEAVDECVNDTFLIVWQRANQFSGEATDFKKWISMITKYKAIDYYRVIEKQKAREKQDEQALLDHPVEDLQTAYLMKEQKNAMLAAISELQEMDRDIFMMKYFLTMSSSEIAETLDLSITAVDNRLSRGRKKLAGNAILKERLT